MLTAQEIIERLGLRPHPDEGGFFAETYRAQERLAAPALHPRYGGPRTVSTAIYYLLTPDTVSALHRLASDEVVAGGKWALLGCTVAPGFEFADYEHGRRQPLARAYPAARDLIVALTRYDSGHDAR